MAELTGFDRAEMRAAAQRASRGRWFRIWNSRSPDSIRICCEGSERSPVATVRCPELSEASSLDAEIQPAYDAAHIAASYPDRVLALLDENERLRVENAKLREALASEGGLCDGCGLEPASHFTGDDVHVCKTCFEACDAAKEAGRG